MFQANQSGQQLLGVVESEEHLSAQKALAKAEADLAFLTEVEAKAEVVNKKAGELVEIEKGSEAFEWTDERTREVLGSVQQRLGDESQELVNGEAGIAAAEEKVALAEAEVESTKGFFSNNRWVFGVIMATLVGLVIIGGISGIATVTSRLVPVMTVTYAVACVVVLLANASEVPAAFGAIVKEAFATTAVAGGFIGAFIQGIRRAAFSNEAGFGSAPIAHSAVKTKHPASEGLVALLEPFVDTIIVCTMTGLAIVVTSPIHQYSAGGDGIQLTSAAFESVMPWFKYILLVCVVLFAFSTMISWSYYGQQAWSYLFGRSNTAEKIYKVMFCVFVVIGASLSLGSVLDFSDGMLFAMSLFNLIGVYVLLPVVRRELGSYLDHVKAMDRK
jgi:AGCS family alanine or glycine:cation symporter